MDKPKDRAKTWTLKSAGVDFLATNIKPGGEVMTMTEAKRAQPNIFPDWLSDSQFSGAVTAVRRRMRNAVGEFLA